MLRILCDTRKTNHGHFKLPFKTLSLMLLESIDDWCKYKKDPLKYGHGELPHRIDMHGDELKKTLTTVFTDYSTDVVKNVAPTPSCQSNESFNNVVGSKNLKVWFYGAGESNNFRTACCVSQIYGVHIYIIVSVRFETEIECKERRTRRCHPSTEIGMNIDSD